MTREDVLKNCCQDSSEDKSKEGYIFKWDQFMYDQWSVTLDDFSKLLEKTRKHKNKHSETKPQISWKLSFRWIYPCFSNRTLCRCKVQSKRWGHHNFQPKTLLKTSPHLATHYFLRNMCSNPQPRQLYGNTDETLNNTSKFNAERHFCSKRCQHEREYLSKKWDQDDKQSPKINQQTPPELLNHNPKIFYQSKHPLCAATLSQTKDWKQKKIRKHFETLTS